jgi:hypothetical protein
MENLKEAMEGTNYDTITLNCKELPSKSFVNFFPLKAIRGLQHFDLKNNHLKSLKFKQE